MSVVQNALFQIQSCEIIVIIILPFLRRYKGFQIPNQRSAAVVTVNLLSAASQINHTIFHPKFQQFFLESAR